MSDENKNEQTEVIVQSDIDDGSVLDNTEPQENVEDEMEVDADMLADAAEKTGVIESEDSAEAVSESEEDQTVEDSTCEDSAECDADTDEESVEEAVEEVIIKSVKSDDGVEVTVESVIEAILFACDEPVTANKLVDIIGAGSVKQVGQCVKDLNTKYEESNSSFRIEKIAGGYQMMTLDAYNHWLRKLIKVRSDNKLTQAALETLSIVAYKQPIMRADVEAIRGVSSGEMIRSLMFKGLVKITGRAEVIGRPMLYGTTKKFLDVFGLNSTKDLPKVEELKKTEQ